MFIVLESALVLSHRIWNFAWVSLKMGLVRELRVESAVSCLLSVSYSYLPRLSHATWIWASARLSFTRNKKWQSDQFWGHTALWIPNGHLNIAGDSLLTRCPVLIELMMCANIFPARREKLWLSAQTCVQLIRRMAVESIFVNVFIITPNTEVVRLSLKMYIPA